MKRKILVVEDHAAVRLGIVEMLNREADLVVCGEADDLAPALEAIASAHPDLVLADIQLKSSDGIELIRVVRRLDPELPVVAMTMFDPVRSQREALSAGANGFVIKQEGAKKIIDAIRSALE